MKKKIFIFICILCLFMTGCGSSTKNSSDNTKKSTEVSVESISASDVEEIVDNYVDNPNIDIIDIRDEDDYNDEHITGAVNIPVEHLSEIHISTDRELIVYGSDNTSTKEACITLIGLGYKVKNMGSFDNYNGDTEEGIVYDSDEED